MAERRLENIAGELAEEWAGREFDRLHETGEIPEFWPGTLEQAREVAAAYVIDAFGRDAFEELSHLVLRRARAAWPGFVAQDRIHLPLGRAPRRGPRPRPGNAG